MIERRNFLIIGGTCRSTARVNFADLASVLAAWGPCGGCDEDVTGDGHVGFADLTDVEP